MTKQSKPSPIPYAMIPVEIAMQMENEMILSLLDLLFAFSSADSTSMSDLVNFSDFDNSVIGAAHVGHFTASSVNTPEHSLQIIFNKHRKKSIIILSAAVIDFSKGPPLIGRVSRRYPLLRLSLNS